jgi:FkbM family methyltransferase
MSLAEFVYTTLLKPRPLRWAANAAIRFVLPRSVRRGDAEIVINPRDPVVSGALAFRVYENSEIAFMRRVCAVGDVVVDVGANVGLYTAIAGLAVGPGGHVVAVEPDPESLGYLARTIAANRLTNVTVLPAAASRAGGSGRLFTSSHNRGDNRMYENALCDGAVEVATICLDDYLAAVGLAKVDVIKIDVQGFEGQVVAGLERTITGSPGLTMMMEFWPYGLSCAGADPIALLRRLASLGLARYELRPSGRIAPIGNEEELVRRLPGRKYTNLVLLGPQSRLAAETT